MLNYLLLNIILQVNSDFSSKLLRIVEDILHHFKHKNAVNEEHTDGIFPPNSPMQTEDVALEFIKHVCAVLALDHNVHHDILVILLPSRVAVVQHLHHRCVEGSNFYVFTV